MSDVNETVQTLRSECEALGIKWHSRHSEEGLRKLIAEASVGDPEPEPAPEPPKPKALPDGMVEARVTKWGHGKISDGEGGKYQRNDVLTLTLQQLEQLEAKHYVEGD